MDQTDVLRYKRPLLHDMRTTLLSIPIAVLVIAFSSQESKAEGGCPSGLYPVGGGYCRDIKCARTVQGYSYEVGYGQMTPDGRGQCLVRGGGCSGTYYQPTGVVEDPKATSTLAKSNQQCPFGSSATWGNLMVPIKK
jgi:hypothetical protein